jgi:16S rRNA (guanine527-N7)-methyltransferase
VLKTEFEKLDLTFDDKFYNRCDKFISLLQDWGAVHNLTGALSRAQIEANIIDSIYPIKFLNDFNSLADIGTGAGYPGMLLAIAKPDKQITLIEPKAKRVAFLNFVKNTLELKNVEVIQNRSQDIKPKNFDLITSRAVTNTSLLLSITNNLSYENTEYLFYKGSLCDEEISEAKIKNYDIIKFQQHRNYLYIKKHYLDIKIKRKGLFDDC